MRPHRRTSGRNPVRSASRFRAAAPVAALLVSAALVAGCGGSDEPAETSEAPPATTESAPVESPADELPTESGGTEAPDNTATKEGSIKDKSKGKSNDKSKSGSGGGAEKGEQDASEVDSKKNDLPPEKGSPAAAFEQFCDENPAACS